VESELAAVFCSVFPPRPTSYGLKGSGLTVSLGQSSRNYEALLSISMFRILRESGCALGGNFRRTMGLSKALRYVLATQKNTYPFDAALPTSARERW
jgi:hypothetical protein